ncbi:hypothetical protein Mgra_00000466 [Meloidogyne graminicola]|uniref:Uncharacterized protein n=1 Tax=Meloidogyne graminicola TaxID=189291 RepID=A0A8T0A1R2_9BILA|nr:hypothetical protein Mgra_00000466 [Meloidogyne graminicola]
MIHNFCFIYKFFILIYFILNYFFLKYLYKMYNSKYFHLILFLMITLVNSRKYKYESSYSFLSLSDKNGLEQKRFCINFQQWRNRDLPSSFEEAPNLRLFWWNSINNTNICQKNRLSKFPIDALVPADYITEFNKLRQLCSEQPGFISSDFHAVRNEVQIMKNVSVKNIIFLMEKGKLNSYGLRNYLFTHFYNAEINNTEYLSTDIFYVYKHIFWQEIEPLLTKTGQLKIYQLKSVLPIDPAVVFLWGFAFISILIGSLWSIFDLKNKLSIQNDICTRLENLQQNQNDLLTQGTSQITNSTQNETNLKRSQSTEIANMNVYQHCISVFFALFIVVFVLMFSFFFRDYAVYGFNLFLVFLGPFSIHSCIYAILQYLLNGWDLEIFTLKQLLFCFKIRQNINENIQSIQTNSSESNIIQQTSYSPNLRKKSFLDRPFLLFSNISFIFSFGICIYWFLIRNHFYSFYLLDFINITICIYAIRFSRIRSLRLITFLLLGMFVYDLFMVFGTRLITSDGCSVMLQVVTGTDCQPTKVPERDFQPVAPIDIKLPEKLPLLFYMPLLADPMSECFDLEVEKEFKNVLLGLGDVILPGYLIAFCFYVDAIKKSRFYLYGLISLIGYSIGMACTFIALLLMETGQPALIYLVPSTLIPVCLWGFFVDSKGTLGKIVSLATFRLTDIYFGWTIIDISRAKSNVPVVSFCARQLGIQEFTEIRDDGQPCDIYWHSVVVPDMNSIVKGGMTEIAKKISLTQAISSMRELFPLEYNFYPRSWILPAQLDEFKYFCSNYNETNKCFIVKPDDGAQGNGIYLINSPTELLLQTTNQRQLIQEYIPDPYLLSDGLKFDLRVYALIRSINPLSIYVAREGMARFCTEKYPGMPTKDNFANLYSHLTNYSLNKSNNAYIHSKSLREQLKGSKRLLSTVFHQMEHKGVKTRRLWREIKLIIVKTVLAMIPEIMLNYENHFCDLKNEAPQCFQIIGLDILIRQNGIPMLLEVNSSPSLSVDHILANNENIWIGGSSEIPSVEQSSSVRSIVDEVPLVRDTLLLVLDQLEYHYPLIKENQTKLKSDFSGLNYQKLENKSTSSTLSIPSTIEKISSKSSLDDFGLLIKAKKPHLSEVFPINYGQVSRHLLVLDKAVYLYMQFCNIKQTILISLPAIRAFIRKCELSNLITCGELEEKFDQISSLFFGNDKKTAIVVSSGAPALPFRGFLHILFHLAKLRFYFINGNIEGIEEFSLLPAFISLLTHCDSALRRYGVRSARLRRIELIMDGDEGGNKNDENNTFSKEIKCTQPVLKIYLLPGRIQTNRRPLEVVNHRQNWINRKRIVTTQSIRAKSLPRKLVGRSTIHRGYHKIRQFKYIFLNLLFSFFIYTY